MSVSESLLDSGLACYKCTKCWRVYQHRKTLNRHMRLECETNGQFPCIYCPYTAKQNVHLKRHLSRRHVEMLGISTTNQESCWSMRGVLTEWWYFAITTNYQIFLLHSYCKNILQYLNAPVFDSHTVLGLQVLFTN